MKKRTSTHDPKVAIKVHAVSKKFVIPHERISTLRSAFVSIFKKKYYETFNALKDVSFEVKKGEFFGIIGRNGSGKSTLLKILAGVYTKDTGTVHITGEVSPFLELGIGFNPELSGRDNIYLNATVLGMSEKEIDNKFQSIVDFSELERFIDQKVKNYSSGMQVRLAFSVAIHANREILLLDEVLAVGDQNFQAKCYAEFHKYRGEGKTVILVTHDTSVIEKYCDRAMLLRGGVIQAIGDPLVVLKEYREQNMSDSDILSESVSVEKEKDIPLASIQEIAKPTITKVVFVDPLYGPRSVFHTGGDLTVRVYFDIPKGFKEKMNFGVAILSDADDYMLGINTLLDKIDTVDFAKRGYVEVAYNNIPLRTGSYYIKANIFGDQGYPVYDFLDRSPMFRVFSQNQNEGSVDISYTWKTK